MDNKEKDFTEMTTEDLSKEVPDISKQFFQNLARLIYVQPVQIDNLDLNKLQESKKQFQVIYSFFDSKLYIQY